MLTHGHVTPNPDGSRARCGGPAICPVCAREAAVKMLDDNKKKGDLSFEHLRELLPPEETRRT